MASGIYITLILEKKSPFSQQIDTLFRDALAGYFMPHTASLMSTSNATEVDNLIIETTGGFQQWQQSGIERHDLMRNVSPLFPSENLNHAHLWTIMEFPNCRKTLVDWVQKYQDYKTWRMSIFGNLSVIMGIDREKREENIVFRHEIQVEQPTFISDTRAHYVAALSINCLYSSKQPNLMSITIGSQSDLWLEQGQAFNGLARATARQNTDLLATRLRDCILYLGDNVLDVERNAIEGQHWLKELERIQRSLSIVPGMHLG